MASTWHIEFNSNPEPRDLPHEARWADFHVYPLTRGSTFKATITRTYTAPGDEASTLPVYLYRYVGEERTGTTLNLYDTSTSTSFDPQDIGLTSTTDPMWSRYFSGVAVNYSDGDVIEFPIVKTLLEDSDLDRVKMFSTFIDLDSDKYSVSSNWIKTKSIGYTDTRDRFCAYVLPEFPATKTSRYSVDSDDPQEIENYRFKIQEIADDWYMPDIIDSEVRYREMNMTGADVFPIEKLGKGDIYGRFVRTKKGIGSMVPVGRDKIMVEILQSSIGKYDSDFYQFADYVEDGDSEEGRIIFVA